MWPIIPVEETHGWIFAPRADDNEPSKKRGHAASGSGPESLLSSYAGFLGTRQEAHSVDILGRRIAAYSARL